MEDKKRCRTLDRFLEPPPPYPPLSPGIEIAPEGRAVVDTSNGIDEVYFLSCHPLSFNGSLSDTDGDEEWIEDYVTEFLVDRAKCRPQARSNGVWVDDDAIESETESSSTEKHDSSDESDDESGDEDGDEDGDQDGDQDGDEDKDNIFDSQARTWRTVLKRREHAAINYTTQARLTHEPINLETWQSHLLINTTIRKIIYNLEGSCPLPSRSITAAGTAYLSFESVPTSALNHPIDGGLQTSPGIQVTDDVFIPVFICPVREASSYPFTSSNEKGGASNGSSSNGSPYRPDYRAPTTATAIGKHPLTTAADGYHHAPEEEIDWIDEDEDEENAEFIVHASFCISCLRDLYAGAVAPETNTTTENDISINSDGDRSQPVTSGEEYEDYEDHEGYEDYEDYEEEEAGTEEVQGNSGSEMEKMTSVVETGGGGNSGSRGNDGAWSAVNLMTMDEEQKNGGGNQQQPQSPAIRIPQLDGVNDPQSGGGGGGGGGGIASGGLGCVVM
ncbi:uncharacterized protein BKCO1_2200087 [Diplodia corticola]|uniref:Uncharacterized protein n=1 Tax=Diplodia corticola TaxID=236234 RepID=A0A1J9R1W8_9PEZI|nr:uncharacterized protein BKCO1_2200087 [Diplodia corticola]OJD34624.1 hypothetical protein BKCO1_2200087 [Diplodia corticola]